MNPQELKKLDNPVWYSLTEYHQKFAIKYDTIKFYHPDYCAFGGLINPDNNSLPLTEYSKFIDDFLIIGEKPIIPDSLKLKEVFYGNQMIIHQKIDLPITETIVKLGNEHQKELLALVKLVYPHFFKSKTANLGNYYGIFKDNNLVAITGERMQMNNFTEVSAVITHPNYTGKSLAKQLVAHTVNTIFDQNKTPFLHVAQNNFRAIKLYEQLGFYTRTEMSFWNIVKQ